MRRPYVSLFIASTFITLSLSGLWLIFFKGGSLITFLHVAFGGLFLTGAFIHFFFNRKSLKKYLERRWIVPLGVLAIVASFAFNLTPIDFLSNSYSRFKANQPQTVQSNIIIEYPLADLSNISVEIRAGEHFWYPQITVWIESEDEKYLETLFTTFSTAKGHFYGGRNKENFMKFDLKNSSQADEFIRVDALPYWSHKRGIVSTDGFFSPGPGNPLPDGITGATPATSFRLLTSHPEIKKFRILLEANVAFDDNEFFSEYDYPDDSLYHNGSGLLGQPSVVYEAIIDIDAGEKYKIMKYKGHTLPSGINGNLIDNQMGLTTALKIIDLALVKVNLNVPIQ